MEILAQKENYVLIKYDDGIYAVEKNIKSINMVVFASEKGEKAINFFAKLNQD